jgi:hypothetical protein
MAIARYQKKISGPLLDRIDIHVEVPRVDYEKLADKRNVEDSKTIRARVQAARERQLERFKGMKITCNMIVNIWVFYNTPPQTDPIPLQRCLRLRVYRKCESITDEYPLLVICDTSWIAQNCHSVIDMCYCLSNNASMLEMFGSNLYPTEK